MRGAAESGNSVEKIRLSEKNIGYCRGCGVCNTTHKCVQNDDMAEILGKMVNADVIVLATPVYFYTMDAQLKTLIDRTVPRYTEISDKEFYFIATAADTDASMLEKTIESAESGSRPRDISDKMEHLRERYCGDNSCCRDYNFGDDRLFADCDRVVHFKDLLMRSCPFHRLLS